MRNSFIALYVIALVITTNAAEAASFLVPEAEQGDLANSFTLIENYQGMNLINGFNFATYDDPTHGFVDYVDRGQAEQLGLFSVNQQQQVILKPETNNVVQQVFFIRSKLKSKLKKRGRKSLRLESKTKFRGGLFIIDLLHMPEGCGTWPAFWACGADWPNNGEIDIIEGVNQQTENYMTLHSRDGCTMNSVKRDEFTGQWAVDDGDVLATNCYVNAPRQFANQGCSIHGGRYGSAFNQGAGGVVVTYWEANEFIKIWNFPRAQIPQDIQQGNPDPSKWGLPSAYFKFGAQCTPDHFNDMSIIINLTFCGDWAGNTFGQDCPGKGNCRDYVAYNPQAFNNAFCSGVVFTTHPHYWRIDGKYYDLTPFLDEHPGGRRVLELSRDRFDDSTYAFEAHHHDWRSVRAQLQKYYVCDAVPEKGEVLPRLCAEDSFYCVLRDRATRVLRQHGGKGPTTTCKALFVAVFVLYLLFYVLMWHSGHFLAAVLTGLVATWLGAIGHNWVHQYRYRFWAYLSLDAIGLNSTAWEREHNLQHHIYTNTARDNHLKGTAPFLLVDPEVPRNWIQKNVTPLLTPFILFFGIVGNYTINTLEVVRGQAALSLGKLFLPIQIALLIQRWGLQHGLSLALVSMGFSSVYYFSIALANHNTESTWNLKAVRASRDWAEAQMHTSCDIGRGHNILQSLLYLWLDCHTVHHLFPHVDVSRHCILQPVVEQTAAEFGIPYAKSTFWRMYAEMLTIFAGTQLPNQ